MFAGCDLYDLALTHTFVLHTCFPEWGLYDLHDLYVFAECDLCHLHDLDRIYPW